MKWLTYKSREEWWTQDQHTIFSSIIFYQQQPTGNIMNKRILRNISNKVIWHHYEKNQNIIKWYKNFPKLLNSVIWKDIKYIDEKPQESMNLILPQANQQILWHSYWIAAGFFFF